MTYRQLWILNLVAHLMQQARIARQAGAPRWAVAIDVHMAQSYMRDYRAR